MPRKEFTKQTKRKAEQRANGKCEAIGVLYGLQSGQRCNGDLSKGKQYDHIIRASDGGDNDLENCAVVCPSCHAHKTTRFDTPQAAKTKRISDKAKGIAKDKPSIPARLSKKKADPKRNNRDPFAGLPRRNLYKEVG